MRAFLIWLTSFRRNYSDFRTWDSQDWSAWRARHRGNRTLERVLLEWHRHQSLAAHDRRYPAERVNELLVSIMKRWP